MNSGINNTNLNSNILNPLDFKSKMEIEKISSNDKVEVVVDTKILPKDKVSG